MKIFLIISSLPLHSHPSPLSFHYCLPSYEQDFPTRTVTIVSANNITSQIHNFIESITPAHFNFLKTLHFLNWHQCPSPYCNINYPLEVFKWKYLKTNIDRTFIAKLADPTTGSIRTFFLVLFLIKKLFKKYQG